MSKFFNKKMVSSLILAAVVSFGAEVGNRVSFAEDGGVKTSKHGVFLGNKENIINSKETSGQEDSVVKAKNDVLRSVAVSDLKKAIDGGVEAKAYSDSRDFVLDGVSNKENSVVDDAKNFDEVKNSEVVLKKDVVKENGKKFDSKKVKLSDGKDLALDGVFTRENSVVDDAKNVDEVKNSEVVLKKDVVKEENDGEGFELNFPEEGICIQAKSESELVKFSEELKKLSYKEIHDDMLKILDLFKVDVSKLGKSILSVVTIPDFTDNNKEQLFLNCFLGDGSKSQFFAGLDQNCNLGLDIVDEKTNQVVFQGDVKVLSWKNILGLEENKEMSEEYKEMIESANFDEVLLVSGEIEKGDLLNKGGHILKLVDKNNNVRVAEAPVKFNLHHIELGNQEFLADFVAKVMEVKLHKLAERIDKSLENAKRADGATKKSEEAGKKATMIEN